MNISFFDKLSLNYNSCIEDVHTSIKENIFDIISEKRFGMSKLNISQNEYLSSLEKHYLLALEYEPRLYKCRVNAIQELESIYIRIEGNFLYKETESSFLFEVCLEN